MVEGPEKEITQRKLLGSGDSTKVGCKGWGVEGTTTLHVCFSRVQCMYIIPWYSFTMIHLNRYTTLTEVGFHFQCTMCMSVREVCVCVYIYTHTCTVRMSVLMFFRVRCIYIHKYIKPWNIIYHFHSWGDSMGMGGWGWGVGFAGSWGKGSWSDEGERWWGQGGVCGGEGRAVHFIIFMPLWVIKHLDISTYNVIYTILNGHMTQWQSESACINTPCQVLMSEVWCRQAHQQQKKQQQKTF